VCLTATCDKWSSIALLILAMLALSVEPRPTRIQHVHPAATIQPRSKLAQVFPLGAQRGAGDGRSAARHAHSSPGDSE
jgi:hypothetical protein